MYTFIELPIPPDAVRYRCESDVLGYAILLLVSLISLFAISGVRFLLGRSVWGRLLPFEDIPSDDIDDEEKQDGDHMSLQAAAEVKDGLITTLEREIEAQKKRYEVEIAAQKMTHEGELAAQKKRHEDDLAAQKTHHNKELKEQKYHYMTKLMDSESEISTVKLTAAADMAEKDKEMKILSNKCRQALDPHYKCPDTIPIAIVASMGVRRAENIEKKLRKRERALADGSLASELEKTKKSTGDRIRALLKQIKARDNRIEELEGEMEKKMSLVRFLDEQHDMLMEMTMDSSEMLARTRRELSEQKTVREELEKVVLKKNEKLEDAGNELWALGVQLHEATVEIAILKADSTAASAKYETLELHHRAAEWRVERLREKVHDVTRGYRRLSKELDKLPGPNYHHWSDGRQAAWLREQIDLELSARKGQEPEEEELACNHVEELAAAATREGELAGRIGALEAEIAGLKQQATDKSNAIFKHTQTEPTQPQPSCNHDGDLAAAAVREGELAGRIEKLESENAVLKKQSTTKSNAISKHTQTERAKPQPNCNHKADLASAAVTEKEQTDRIRVLDLENVALTTQLTAKSNALQTILEQAEALHTQMATELHATDPEKVTITECVDQYRSLADEANRSAQTQEIELNELRVEHNTTEKLLKAVKQGRDAVLKTLDKKEKEIKEFQKQVTDNKAEIYQQQCLITSKEAECVKVRDERKTAIAELERQISLVGKTLEQRLATEAQVTAETGAELHLAAYLSHQNFRLPVIAAVERDVLSAKAIAEERAAAPYDAYAMNILAELAELNKDIDKLRSTLQDPEARPSRQDLRDFLESGEIDVVATKLEQAAPRLYKQVVEANTLASALGDMVNVEVANCSAEEIEAVGEQLSPKEQDEIEVGVVDDDATEFLCRKMLGRLMKPRDAVDELADETMAYPQRMA